MAGQVLQGPTAAANGPSIDLDDLIERHATRPSMGGTLSVRVVCPGPEGARAARDIEVVMGRVEAWASKLTRYSDRSDLSALNADAAAERTSVAPTLAAVLEAAQRLAIRTEGMVDVSQLDERLAAESGVEIRRAIGSWSVEGNGRASHVLRRGRVRFDLDGVAKGWLADRALERLQRYPAAAVDADGDIALHVSPGIPWPVAIADPADDSVDLAILDVPVDEPRRRFGIATSGTSVHRWSDGGEDAGASDRHHLIDPRTRRPARTDVVQATVVAERTDVAEGLAKAAVIAGSDEGLRLLDRSGAWAAVLLLDDRSVVATPATQAWLR